MAGSRGGGRCSPRRRGCSADVRRERRVRRAGSRGGGVVAAGADVEFGVGQGLAREAVLDALLEHAKGTGGLAAAGGAHAVGQGRVDERALHVAHAQEELLVGGAGAGLMRADLVALMHARDVEAAAPAHVVLAAFEHLEGILGALCRLAARPSALTVWVLTVGQAAALVVAQPEEALFIGAAAVATRRGCRRRRCRCRCRRACRARASDRLRHHAAGRRRRKLLGQKLGVGLNGRPLQLRGLPRASEPGGCSDADHGHDAHGCDGPGRPGKRSTGPSMARLDSTILVRGRGIREGDVLQLHGTDQH
mmetsp:Transcript_56211/g.182426  ORF Transcript_56211/g.182426 Transcript_56211/m.182426 type:complete len:307 (-) Transcript_56211:75-995(-)